MQTIQITAYSLPISVYVMMVIGGYVSSTRAGLTCPDWPLCYGKIIPTFTTAILIKYTHRLFALIVSIMVALNLLLVMKNFKPSSMAALTSIATTVLLIAQVLLGMFTVTSEFHPLIATAHLAVATTIFASSMMTAMFVHISLKKK